MDVVTTIPPRIRVPVRYRLFALALGLASLGAFFLSGCGGKSEVNPALLVGDQQQVDEAVKRGKKYWGSDPYEVYKRKMQQPPNPMISKLLSCQVYLFLK